MPLDLRPGQVLNDTTLEYLGRVQAGNDGWLVEHGAVTASSPTAMTVQVAAIPIGTCYRAGLINVSAFVAAAATITAAHATLPRRDLVVYNVSTNAVSVIAGTPLALGTTTGPSLPAPGANQLPLAEIAVAAAAVTIESTDIYDLRQAVPSYSILRNMTTLFASGMCPQETLAELDVCGLGVLMRFNLLTGAGGTGVMSTTIPGFFNLGTSVTASRASALVAGGVGARFLATQDWNLECKVMIPNDANRTFLFGLTQALNMRDTNNLICWRALSSGNYVGVSDSAGTETTRDSAVLPDGATVQRLGIRILAAGTIVQFIRNGAQVGADVTTNIPTVGMGIVAGISNEATAADYHVHIADFNGARRGL